MRENGVLQTGAGYHLATSGSDVNGCNVWAGALRRRILCRFSSD
jgi:hypothetical protein